MAIDKEKLERLGLYADLVFDETQLGANTHERVGQALKDAHDCIEDGEVDGVGVPSVALAEIDTLRNKPTDLEDDTYNKAVYAVYAPAPNGVDNTCVGVLNEFLEPNTSTSTTAEPVLTATQVFFTNLRLVDGVFNITSEDRLETYIYTRSSDGTTDTGWRLIASTNASLISVGGEAVLARVEERLLTKQDVLTPGEGITIDDNVISAQYPTLEQQVAYGIRRNVADSDPACTRIGNMDLHRTLPVQSQMRGCLLDDEGNVVEYLPDSSWVDATTDGSRGQVMVELPKHYRKCQLLSDGTMEVWLSLYALPDYEEVPLMYVGAYQATVQRSVNKLCSVRNFGTDYRGGNNTASRDEYYYSTLGKPAGTISSNNFRTYARNRGEAGLNGCGWNSMLYMVQKTLYWFFVVEYATLNSQTDYNAELTEEGYHQGGLSASVTNLSENRWMNWWNGTRQPFLDCGITNDFGNNTGVLQYTMPFEYDGASATSGDTGTRYIGEYDAECMYTAGDYCSVGDDLYQCLAECSDVPVTNTDYWKQVTRTVTNIPRYRGVELPFGHILIWCCDILVSVHPSEENGGDGLSPVYVCKDPAKFSGTSYEDYTFIGNFLRTTDYISAIHFGREGEIIGSDGGGSSSTYYCDRNGASSDVTEETLRTVAFGGYAFNGSGAGFVYAGSSNSPSYTNAYYGSRLCFLPADNT